MPTQRIFSHIAGGHLEPAMMAGRPVGVLALMIAGLLATNALVWTLLALNLTRWSSTSIGPIWLINHRSTISIVVQVIAQLLGMIVTTVLGAIINLSARARLTYDSYSLEALDLLNALCGARLNWSLRFRKQILLLLFVGVSFAPAAFWAGAITPLVVTWDDEGKITVPRYNVLTPGIDPPGGIADPALTNVTLDGTFTYRPEITLQGQILDNMRQASSINGSQTTQSTMNNVNYRYLGRTYGAGSSVSLRTPFVDSTVQSYKYAEAGLLVTSKCIYNSSSACYFEEKTPNDSWTLRVYNAIFSLPNMDPDPKKAIYIASAGQREDEILVVSATSGQGVISEDWTYYAAMMTPGGSKGAEYGRLHRVQCELEYAPWDFQVSVNVTNSTMAVKPIGPADPGLFPNYTALTRAMTRRIYFIGQLFASTQWGSPMGDALMSNLKNLALSKGESTDDISNDTVLEGVSASMNSMLDSMLLALAGSQIVNINDTMQQPVKISTSVVVLGERTYIYFTCAINLTITIVFIVEFFRTRQWEKTPGFDFMSVQNLVLAASAGGTAVAKEAHSMSLSAKAGDVRVMLSESDEQGQDVLTLAYRKIDDEHSGSRARRMPGVGGTFQLGPRRPTGGYAQI